MSDVRVSVRAYGYLCVCVFAYVCVHTCLSVVYVYVCDICVCGRVCAWRVYVCMCGVLVHVCVCACVQAQALDGYLLKLSQSGE